MTTRGEKLRELAERGATEGEREAARRALDRHREKLLTTIPEVEPEQPGPDLTRRGRPYPAKVDGEGKVWVAVREGEHVAQSWVDERRRMLVKLDGARLAMVPATVEVDDERQQVYVTADSVSLAPW